MFNIKISGVVALACLAIAGCSPADAPVPSATAPDSSAAAPAAKAQASSNSVLAKDHFHPKGKEPSEYTKRILREARSDLPFSDKRDFEEYAKGFIAAPDSKIIMAGCTHPATTCRRMFPRGVQRQYRVFRFQFLR